jgi:hypothetical protein
MMKIVLFAEITLCGHGVLGAMTPMHAMYNSQQKPKENTPITDNKDNTIIQAVKAFATAKGDKKAQNSSMRVQTTGNQKEVYLTNNQMQAQYGQKYADVSLFDAIEDNGNFYKIDLSKLVQL